MKRSQPLDPLPPERVQDVVAHVVNVLPKLYTAKTSDDALAAITEMLGGMTDVLSIPLFAEIAAKAMTAGARDALAEMRETRKMSGVQLLSMRKAAGLTQLELATRLGCPQSTISHWEHGDEPVPRRRVAAILEALVPTAPLAKSRTAPHDLL
jgi:DNA-binding transcriptional regulator YiaG